MQKISHNLTTVEVAERPKNSAEDRRPIECHVEACLWGTVRVNGPEPNEFFGKVSTDLIEEDSEIHVYCPQYRKLTAIPVESIVSCSFEFEADDVAEVAEVAEVAPQTP